MKVGKVQAVPANDLMLGGRDINMFHAELNNIEGKIYLKPLSQKCHLYVNGKQVTSTI
jgi:hypothetical protein